MTSLRLPMTSLSLPMAPLLCLTTPTQRMSTLSLTLSSMRSLLMCSTTALSLRMNTQSPISSSLKTSFLCWMEKSLTQTRSPYFFFLCFSLIALKLLLLLFSIFFFYRKTIRVLRATGVIRREATI